MIVEIFKEILKFSIMGSVVACIILVGKSLLKKILSAKWHYYIWFILIIRLMVPYLPRSSVSIFNVINPKDNYTYIESFTKDIKYVELKNINTREIENYSSDNNDLLTNNDRILNKKSKDKINIYKIISLIWLIGVILISLFIVKIKVQLRLKSKKFLPCKDKNIIFCFNKAKEVLKVKQNIQVLVHNENISPYIIQIIHPKLILPNKLIKHLNSSEIKHIMLHELSHIKRKDILVNEICLIIQIIHWFNPIIWLSFYKMRQDCELSCDEYVLLQLQDYECKTYAKSILSIAEKINIPYKITFSAQMINKKSLLKRRIEMINNFNKKNLKYSIFVKVITFLMGVVLLTNTSYATKVNKSISNVKNESYEVIKQLLPNKFDSASKKNEKAKIENIVNKLIGKQYLNTFHTGIKQIKPKKTYIVLDYATKNESEYYNLSTFKKMIVDNSTSLFILKEDLDSIVFQLPLVRYNKITIYRSQMEEFYGKKLNSRRNNIDWLNKQVENNNIFTYRIADKFFENYLGNNSINKFIYFIKNNSTENYNEDLDYFINSEMKELLKFKRKKNEDNLRLKYIISQLPAARLNNRMALGIDSVKLYYENIGQYSQKEINDYWRQNVKKTIINNSTALFMLDDNLEKVTFNIDTVPKINFQITREEIEKFYDYKMIDCAKDYNKCFQDTVIKTLGFDERIDEFYNIIK